MHLQQMTFENIAAKGELAPDQDNIVQKLVVMATLFHQFSMSHILPQRSFQSQRWHIKYPNYLVNGLQD